MLIQFLAAIVVMGISLSVIYVLEKADVELPGKITFSFLFVCTFTSAFTLISEKEMLIYVVPLLILALISAYTDYHIRQLYDAVSVTALIIGTVLLCIKNIGLLKGFGMALILIFLLYAIRCMKWGDVLLLTASYPYTACIVNAENDIVLFVFVSQIFIALFFSVIVNLRHLLHDVRYETCFGPYYLISVILFVGVMA